MKSYATNLKYLGYVICGIFVLGILDVIPKHIKLQKQVKKTREKWGLQPTKSSESSSFAASSAASSTSALLAIEDLHEDTKDKIDNTFLKTIKSNNPDIADTFIERNFHKDINNYKSYQYVSRGSMNKVSEFTPISATKINDTHVEIINKPDHKRTFEVINENVFRSANLIGSFDHTLFEDKHVATSAFSGGRKRTTKRRRKSSAIKLREL